MFHLFQNKKKKYSTIIPLGHTPHKSDRKSKLNGSIGASPIKYNFEKINMIPPSNRDMLIKEKRSSLLSSYQLTNDSLPLGEDINSSKIFESISTMSTLILLFWNWIDVYN